MSSAGAEFMARAIQLAWRGRNTTDPNPRVGCILVRDEAVIAEGWHVWAGQGHAEVEALAKVPDARNATAYVTLEPCSHYGRTAPCSEALIKAGIKRVVIAMQDPNPQVAGRGIARLREAGIEVECGLLELQARALNPGFIKRMETGLPFVTCKMAMSLDGRTALASGESKWITSAQARQDVHRLRAASSVLLTGINTVLADDPGMDVRLDVETVYKAPARVVLDSTLKMPATAKILKTEGPCMILTGADKPQLKDRLEQEGCEVFRLPLNAQGSLELSAVLRFLAGHEFNDILVEAGATLNGALLHDNLVDRWIVYMAPVVLGDQGKGLFKLPALKSMMDKRSMTMNAMRRIGPDLRLELQTIQ